MFRSSALSEVMAMHTASKQNILSIFATVAGSITALLALGGAHAAGNWAPDSAGSIRARIERLPASDIKRVYLRCEQVATEARLTVDDAAACSVVYDVLLKHHFAGNYDALHAWWKAIGAPLPK